MLGVAILIIVMSVMNGFRTELTNKILGFNPHLIIKPYNQKNIDLKFRNQLSKNFPSIEVLESYSGEGVVINNDYAKGIMIKGLDPKNEKNLIFLNKILIEGKKNKIKKGGIVVGKELAIELNLAVGDKINLLSSVYISTPFGSLPKQETYSLEGIFSSGFYEFDKNVVFLNLDEALYFFDKTKRDINLEIYLPDPLNANDIKDKIGLILKSLVIAAFGLFATTTTIAAIFILSLGMEFHSAVIYAIPLSVISSAIVIPSISNLVDSKKEFLIYESAFSDILGIMFFYFYLDGLKLSNATEIGLHISKNVSDL